MGTLRDYFTTDQDHGVKVTQNQEITGRGGYKVPCQMFLDFGSGAITLAFYLGTVTDPLQRCLDLVTGNAIDAVLSVSGGFSVQTAYPADAAVVDATTLRFCGRVHIFSENTLAEADIATLRQIARQRSLIVHYRGPEWASQRAALEKPLAFISHDSREYSPGLANRKAPNWTDGVVSVAMQIYKAAIA